MMNPNEVLFKKKTIKGNIRKKENQETIDNNSNSNKEVIDNDNNDEIDKRLLEDIKLQQTMRNRKSGSSLNSLLSNKTKNETNMVESIKTIESVMGTQYTSQIDYGIENNSIPHKKLMDEYINNKLGISKETK